jgi:hypothetical protein
VIAYHAIMVAGGCTVPIDPNLPASEISEIIRITKAEAVFHLKPGLDPVTGRKYSFSAGNQAVNLQLQCRLYDGAGNQITPAFSTITFTDFTPVANFFPAADTVIRYPVSKFIIALTDPKFSSVRRIIFALWPTTADYILPARIAFDKRMEVNFLYTTH